MPQIPATDPALFLWFLPLTIVIGLWVSWSDMKFMKIPNKAVMALTLIWVVLGWPVTGMTVWLWGLALLVAVLVIGFLVATANLVGAGDAKFAAAMAPFFTGADIDLLLRLFAACLLGAFAMHRIARAIPAVRRATPDWASWTHRKFPMGLALSGTLIFYPLCAALLP
jgi:prepilin peptidase CpaA